MEKVQSETRVGAMTPEQILELAHEAGFPRDTIFYRSDQFITFAQAVAQRTREECAAAIPTTRNEVQLMCGELNSGEWRTVSAMLSAVQRQIRSMTK